ncbi:MAG: AbrB/MazE/SpoVT family DNA-binding domain-containing protein [Gemmatimonadaceae bacterium]|nr:AbrB/MazE/SpoVT family DNA-binding domain-containing protein [Gemmatimonadaceae bacterium]
MKRKVVIDQAGRLVIPKDIRSRYGFEPGYHIELEDTGAEIVLRPAQLGDPIIRHLENGFPVIEWPGQTQKETYDIVAEVRKSRDERNPKFSGE